MDYTMLPMFFTGCVVIHHKPKAVEMHIYAERKRFYAVPWSGAWKELYKKLPQSQVEGDRLWLQSRDMATAVNELRGILEDLGELEPTVYFVTIARDRYSLSNNPHVARHFRIEDRGDYRRIAIFGGVNCGKWPDSKEARAFFEKVKANRHVRRVSWSGSALDVELNPSSAMHTNRLKTLEELLRLHEVC
ncbi:MAG TPA: hypothetical protein VFO38_00220 [Candidatus Saccharimonadales bacterium]|nr:hypothetical protein [Candidatus Saccharimonadales bacterium]